MKIHDVIYVPGIGDDPRGLQEKLIQTWKIFGARPHRFELPWDGQQSFDSKLAHLLSYIDGLTQQGHRVSLVGASAGAGAVINAFAARPDTVSGVICIAGKVNHPQTIGSAYRKRSAAFHESAVLVKGSLAQLDELKKLAAIQSRYALLDPIVLRRDSIVKGATNVTVPTIGHATTIATQLVFGAPFYLKFLKEL